MLTSVPVPENKVVNLPVGPIDWYVIIVLWCWGTVVVFATNLT